VAALFFCVREFLLARAFSAPHVFLMSNLGPPIDLKDLSSLRAALLVII
jgi:hypothetical protein